MSAMQEALEQAQDENQNVTVLLALTVTVSGRVVDVRRDLVVIRKAVGQDFQDFYVPLDKILWMREEPVPEKDRPATPRDPSLLKAGDRVRFSDGHSTFLFLSGDGKEAHFRQRDGSTRIIRLDAETTFMVIGNGS